MNERVIKTEYSEIMQKSFLDYAMSVIVARALPDVRDGLKPVQRRVLYDMYELGIRYDRPYRKCARIVGDTMGKYHPHGDSSIYEALVLLTQDFKKGLPLIDGHGNFGNIEGDGAAAMRYTEARLEKVTQEYFLADLDKDIVDFAANFDETEREPTVLPVRFPNLLVGGSEGIAVGMATSIPPHNLAEVCDATKAYMRNNDITTAELMQYVKGPDFPTGGVITNQDDLLEIYESGHGRIRVRGTSEVKKGKAGKINLVVNEIPYPMIGMGIGRFLSEVAALYEAKLATDIVDISNQSGRDGIRIVIELKKEADIEALLNLLYKKTRLADTFAVNMLAINDGRPETMGLKNIIAQNVEFQFEITKRKYTTLLEKEREKKEIQEGLIKACNVIDLIIEILRGSKDRAMAKACLTAGKIEGIKFRSKESKVMAAELMFTERQANAILEMRLYRLIGLEIEALIDEHENTIANIFRYEDILERKESMSQVIINDLDEIKAKFGRPRRTRIENIIETAYKKPEVAEMDLVFLIDRFGYVRTIDESTYERNKEAADQEHVFVGTCKNTGRLCLFGSTGLLHTVKVSDIPLGKLRDKGIPLDNISNYDSQNETLLLAASQNQVALCQLIFVSQMSLMKLVDGSEFDVSKRLVTATKLLAGDQVLSVSLLERQRDIVLQTKNGFFLRFSIEEIAEKKKGAAGVRGMKLAAGDSLHAVHFLTAGVESMAASNDKKVDLGKLRLGRRDTKGTKVRT
ncbi:MAG: DNA topoisomerase 4 subunit A [Lachnospiraceae bacterium]|jgi:DNA gyrase subunit A|nr:DNA topoisomerase 4 subunit A [Lachnospiraceae bacterium]